MRKKRTNSQLSLPRGIKQVKNCRESRELENPMKKSTGAAKNLI